MGVNDRIILDQVLAQSRKEVAPDLPEADFFELFVAEQILKDFDLSYDEVASGIVGNGGDGGIDALFIFLNGELVQEDTVFTDQKRNVLIEVLIIQAKTSSSFSESALDKFTAVTEDVFDLSKELDTFTSVYNAELLAKIRLFRQCYQSLASRFPRLSISFYYAAKGNEVHPNVERKSHRIEMAVKALFSSIEFKFEFLNARNILDLARKVPNSSYELRLADTPISATDDGAFIALATLRDYYAFVTDARGKLVRSIFEANVRDYQGRTQVNEQIQDTLQSKEKEDFWWLNNGVTILATRATQSGKTLAIENPEIVNGLQTTTEVYSYISRFGSKDDPRKLLIRVIVPIAPESRDRIIKATNSQTPIPAASLRATDSIHRDIEQFLKSFGIYYDRRKNFYKNEGKPIGRIIGIAQMAQAVMAIALFRPDSARARPSSLLNNNTEYQELFNTAYPIELYLVCAELLKKVEAFLSVHLSAPSAAERNNLKFYAAALLSRIVLRKLDPSTTEIATITGSDISLIDLDFSHASVRKFYIELGANDQVAKGKDLLGTLKRELPDLLQAHSQNSRPFKAS